MTHEVQLTVNGRAHTVRVPARKLLVDCLREDLRLTGTHVGCEQGVCGACTILIDGRPVRSCLMFTVQAAGAELETIESLARSADELHPIQQAFQDCHGLQCGFCTPAMVLTAKAFLEENPAPSDQEIREAIANNIYHYTNYTFIIKTIKTTTERLH